MTSGASKPKTEKRASLFAALRCPYCGSALEEVVQLPGEFGVLRCGCAQYPVLDGIPILQHTDGLREVVRFVESGDTSRALLKAMNIFGVRWAHPSRWHKARYYLNCWRLTSNSRLTFEDGIELVRKPKGFADYLFHRYANPSLMSDMILMPLMGAFFDGRSVPRAIDGSAVPFRVLDLACGAGHSSFLISDWFPHVSVIAADEDFVSLYLAKRFLAPGADYVCADGEVPSPFPDAYFDAVHCLDAFHYLKSKRAIVAELTRVAKAGALWLFPHLHNALVDNVTAGIPLSPQDYARCFDVVDPLLFDEADLRRSVCVNAGPTRLRARSPDELSRAQSLALVGGAAGLHREPDLLSVWMCRNRSSLRINPIYQGAWHGRRLKLELRWPNEVLHRECLNAESILPQTCDIARDDLDALLNGHGPVDEGLVRDLIGRFVLVPLAAGYSRRDFTSASAVH